MKYLAEKMTGRIIEKFINHGIFSSIPSKIENKEDSFVKNIKSNKEKIFNFPTQADTEKSIENNILGKGKTPQNIAPSKSNSFSGKCLTFHKPRQSEIIDSKDACEFPVVVVPGLGGGDSEDRLYESWHPFSQLLSVYPQDMMIYSPLLEGEERPKRFREGLPYYYDESYINKTESTHFFDNVLKPRFFDDGKLRDPETISPLLLAGFSIGYREVKSHLNFLYEEISKTAEKEGSSNQQHLIQEYFNKIAVINVASPLNWSGRKLPKEIISALAEGEISPKEAEELYIKEGSPKEKTYPPVKINILHYRSVVDRGTAKPEDDFNNFHCNRELYHPEIFYFIRPDTKEAMYVMGTGLIKSMLLNNDKLGSSYKNNSLGHNLDNYLESIYENPKLFRPIENLQHFLSTNKSANKKIDFTNTQYQLGTTMLLFNENRCPDEKDRLALIKAWHSELIIQAALGSFKNQQNNQKLL